MILIISQLPTEKKQDQEKKEDVANLFGNRYIWLWAAGILACLIKMKISMLISGQNLLLASVIADSHDVMFTESMHYKSYRIILRKR